MHDEALVGEAKRLIDALAASPRFAGSREERNARELCAGVLQRAGLATTETPFEFSQWPGRFGIPLVAGWLLLGIIIAWATAAIFPQRADPIVIAYLFVVPGFVYAARRRPTATARMSSYRTTSVNLEGVRGNAHVWLVAHLDSKSQSVPMLVRVASHVALITVFVATYAIGFAQLIGWAKHPQWGWLVILAGIAALPSLFCVVGNKSRGALDNATGVAAVLLAAGLVSRGKSFGVLITSGEELDLAGARAWSAGAHKGATMINCDTVDDAGSWRCMFQMRPHALGMAAERAAKKLGLALRMGKVIPGILTDSLAFEAAGLPAVTLSRGTLRTLARLHTRADSPDRVIGSGAAAAASMLAEMVEELG